MCYVANEVAAPHKVAFVGIDPGFWRWRTVLASGWKHACQRIAELEKELEMV